MLAAPASPPASPPAVIAAAATAVAVATAMPVTGAIRQSLVPPSYIALLLLLLPLPLFLPLSLFFDVLLLVNLCTHAADFRHRLTLDGAEAEDAARVDVPRLTHDKAAAQLRQVVQVVCKW